MKRNIERFPDDFIFRLTKEEYKTLRFQFGIIEKGKHSKYLPNAFTKQGVEFKTAKRGWLKLHLNRGFFGSERLQLIEMSNLITV